jgi:hypothetical protein
MVAPPPGVPASHGFKNFKYEPLDLSSNKPSIRLAVLHAVAISSAIRITLATAAFADRPRYEARSYTWGRPDVLKGIALNGIRVDIRENLWDALVNLRDAREDRVLWIDAICIQPNRRRGAQSSSGTYDIHIWSGKESHSLAQSDKCRI